MPSINYHTLMLVAQWIVECLQHRHRNFTMLCSAVNERAKDHPLAPTATEIRVVLARLVRDGSVEACQFLAEDQRFAPTVYSEKSIHFYWFRAAGMGGNDEPRPFGERVF